MEGWVWKETGGAPLGFASGRLCLLVGGRLDDYRGASDVCLPTERYQPAGGA